MNDELVADVDTAESSASEKILYLSRETEKLQKANKDLNESCVDFPNQSSAEDMKRHIEQNFDNSPFNESIAVSRHNFESNNGHGAVYHVTFIGPAYSHDAEELLLVSNLAPWHDTSCGYSFKINGAMSSKVSTTITTAMASPSLSPGTRYYVQIAAQNSVGFGPYANTKPEAEIPRSRPELAQKCHVYSIPCQDVSVLVEWYGVKSNNGVGPVSCRVDFYSEGVIASSSLIEESPESQFYFHVESNLTAGVYYEVEIVATNNQGEGAPLCMPI